MTRRTVGALLILLGAIGMALCALGVVGLWRLAADVRVSADETLVLLADTLKDVDRSLDVASSTLDGSALAMDGLYTTTLDVTATLSSTRMTIDGMAALTEDDLPQSIEASLVALEALEETAAVIDQVLRGLQQFGVADYEPETPLDQAVAQAGAGLEPIPASLRVMGGGLRQTGASLEGVQGGLASMSEHMMGIRRNVGDAEVAISSHRSTLEELQTRVRMVRLGLDGPIRAVAWAGTLLLIWIGLSQLAVVRWGIGLWQRRPVRVGGPAEAGAEGESE